MPINTNNLDKRENIHSILTQQTALSNLPLELIYRIFSQLSKRGIQCLSCVSKQWQTIIAGYLSTKLRHDVEPLLNLFQNVFKDSYKNEYNNSQSLVNKFHAPKNVQEYQSFASKIKQGLVEEWKIIPAEKFDSFKKEDNTKFQTNLIELTIIYNQIESCKNNDNLNQEQKDSMLTGLIPDLIKYGDHANDLNRAEEFTHLISNDSKYTHLYNIFEKYLKSNNLNKATKLIHLISTADRLSPAAINEATQKLVTKYIEIGNLEKAEEVANLTIYATYKDPLLRAIIRELIKKDRFDQADELLGKISSHDIKAQAFKTMIRRWVKDGKYQEAYHRIINTFKDSPKQTYGQSYLLKFMVEQLVEKEDFDKAQWFADLIQDKKMRKEALDQIPKKGALDSIKNFFSG